MFIRIVDFISEITGMIAAWMFFVIGLIVTYEVVMRYVFTLPTIWVDDMSRYLQIWATFLAAGYVVKCRQMVSIDIAFRDHRALPRKVVETFGILVMLVFCAVAVKYGFDLWMKSLLTGKRSATMLAAPMWMIQSSIWVGFGLLFLQGLSEIIKIWTHGIPADDVIVESH